MEASSHTLGATSCFIAVKMNRQKTKPVASKGSKRGKSRGTNQTPGSTAGQATFLPTDVAFKALIFSALKDLHGDLGLAGHSVDVLSWDPVCGEGRLRLPARSLVPVRAALSLLGSCGNTPCVLDVTAVSPFLAGLACERYL